MKETLRKANATANKAQRELVGAIITVVEAQGDTGFIFGEYCRPGAIDLLPKPLTEPLAEHPVEVVRIHDDEWQAKVEGCDKWYPLTLDLGYEELYLSPIELATFMLMTLDKA